MVERQAKRAKRSEVDVDLYNVTRMTPLTPGQLEPLVARLCGSQQAARDEAVLAAMAAEVGGVRGVCIFVRAPAHTRHGSIRP